MTKYIHCVFVRHSDKKKAFLFSVDSCQKLKTGTEVLCQTSKGKAYGQCVGDSFMVPETTLQSLVLGADAYLPLKSVVGIVTETYVPRKEVKRCDDNVCRDGER